MITNEVSYLLQRNLQNTIVNDGEWIFDIYACGNTTHINEYSDSILEW